LRLFTTPHEYHLSVDDHWYITGNTEKFLSPENLKKHELSTYTVTRWKVDGSENSAFLFTHPSVTGTQHILAVESDWRFYCHPVRSGVYVGYDGYPGTIYKFYGLTDYQWNIRANEDKEQLSKTLKEAFEKRVSEFQCLKYGIPFTVRYSRVPETDVADSGYESLDSRDSVYSGQIASRISWTVQTETKKYMCGISNNWYTLKKPDGVEKKTRKHPFFQFREITGLGPVKKPPVKIISTQRKNPPVYKKNPKAAKPSTVKDPEDITGLE
jgi:hypothetical protein